MLALSLVPQCFSPKERRTCYKLEKLLKFEKNDNLCTLMELFVLIKLSQFRVKT
jgi:hypothetical protein